MGVPRDGRRVLGGRGSPVIAPLPHLAHNSISCLNNRVLEFLGALLPQGSRWQYGKTHSFGAFQYVRPEDAIQAVANFVTRLQVLQGTSCPTIRRCVFHVDYWPERVWQIKLVSACWYQPNEP